MSGTRQDSDDELVAASTQGFGQAVKWSFGMNVAKLLATLGTSFVLAGLLGPSQFGIVALATIVISLLQMLMAQGLSPAVVQRPNLTRRHLDSAFWATMVASVVLAAVGILLSEWWASVNDSPEAGVVIRVLCALVVVKGLVVVQDALMRRQLRFRELAIRSTAASVAGAAVGLTWAFVEPSVWALVAQQLTTETIGCLVLWNVSGWRPRFKFWFAEAKELLPFASKASLSSIGVFVNNRVDTLLVGVYFGAAAVGIYRLASRLVESAIELSIQPVQHVALPEFARYQHDPNAAAERYRSLVVMSTAVGGIVMAGVFATARPLLATVGDEWTSGTVALQLLCVVGLVRAMTMLNGAAIQAAGHPGLQAAMTWIAAGLSALGFALAGLSLTNAELGRQVVGMATSRAALYAIVLLPLGQAWLIKKAIGVSAAEFARLVFRPVVVAISAAALGDLLARRMMAGGVPSAIGLVAVGAATFVAAAAGMFVAVPRVRSTLSTLPIPIVGSR